MRTRQRIQAGCNRRHSKQRLLQHQSQAFSLEPIDLFFGSNRDKKCNKRDRQREARYKYTWQNYFDVIASLLAGGPSWPLLRLQILLLVFLKILHLTRYKIQTKIVQYTRLWLNLWASNPNSYPTFFSTCETESPPIGEGAFMNIGF